MTGAGFVQIVSNPAFSRDAVPVLSANTVAKDHAFWEDDVPVAEAVTFSGGRLMGRQQVTDAYLLGLAIRRGGVLAALDPTIAWPTQVETVERKAVEFVGRGWIEWVGPGGRQVFVPAASFSKKGSPVVRLAP
jgi:hypothetical protein